MDEKLHRQSDGNANHNTVLTEKRAEIANDEFIIYGIKFSSNQ